MAKKGQELVDRIADEAAARLRDEATGFPNKSEEARLAEQEKNRPLDDVDFFDYVHESFIAKGRRVEFYIKKDGAYKTTLNPPLNWEILRKKCGPGHYVIVAKDAASKTYLAQKTDMVDPEPETPSDDEANPFNLGGQPQSSGADLTSIISLMQTQDQRRSDQQREDRQREEDRRREERERDDTRRREERESRKEMISTALAALPALLPVLLPKKDDNVILEVMKENLRNQQEQNRMMMEKIERALTAPPPKPEMDSLKLIDMLQQAEDRGWKKREKISEEIDEKAELRAEELAASGKDDDSTLALVLKNIGPGLIALAQSRGGAALPAPVEDADGGDETPAIEAQTAPAPQAALPAQARKPAPRRAPTKDELDAEAIVRVVVPFLGEQAVRMSQNHSVDSKAAARETLQLLKTKGFPQARVLQLFSRDALFKILRSYQVPKDYDSWFNEYYGTLSIPEAQPPVRDRTKTATAPKPLKPQTTTRAAAPAAVESGSGDGSGGDSQPAGASRSSFVQHGPAKTPVVLAAEPSGNGAAPLPGKLPGGSAEVASPLSS